MQRHLCVHAANPSNLDGLSAAEGKPDMASEPAIVADVPEADMNLVNLPSLALSLPAVLNVERTLTGNCELR